MAGDADVEAWSHAVQRRLGELAKSQRWLGETVAAIEGRAEPYGQGTVGGWLEAGPPKPDQAFAIERALEVAPGSQTRLLGYLPVSARPVKTPEEALEADSSIGRAFLPVLIASIREARKRSR